MEPFGLALSPHECLIRPFELLHYAAAQNYLLFLSSSQLIKKGKVLPSLKKCRLDERDLENKLLKQGRVTLKKMCLSAWRLKEYICVLRTGHFEMSVFVFLLSVAPLTSPISAQLVTYF